MTSHLLLESGIMKNQDSVALVTGVSIGVGLSQSSAFRSPSSGITRGCNLVVTHKYIKNEVEQ